MSSQKERTYELFSKEYSCTFEIAMDLIGGKWKPIILWHLGTKGTKRFNELRRLMPKVTQKMLTQQLRELESAGLIHREVFSEVPPKVEYKLTVLGEKLMPILSMMCTWGCDYYNEYKNEAQEKVSGLNSAQV